jgi:cytoplasmic iron level regulating protein YaaA (DUF328/UPF0246 family)
LRSAVLESLVTLSADPDATARVLKLGPKQADEARRNRGLRRAPVLPAIERYSGVLYDGVAVRELDPAARGWLDEHVLIGSALFGLVGAADPIPAYRLSAGAPLPGLPLAAHWRPALSRTLRRQGGWVLDARSAAYAALGPAPAGSAVLAVEQESSDGRRTALNHFNKHAKGALARRLAETRPEIASRDDLLAWGAAAGIRLEPRGDADVTLVVPACSALR